MRRRLALVSLSVISVAAGLGVVAAAKRRPLHWFKCVATASTGSMTVTATGESAVFIRFRNTDPDVVPVTAQWRFEWGPDGGSIDADGTITRRSSEATRATAAALISGAEHPGAPPSLSFLSPRVKLALTGRCDGEEGQASLFTDSPTLTECRAERDVNEFRGSQCYRTWLSSTLHGGSAAATALLYAMLDGGSP